VKHILYVVEIPVCEHPFRYELLTANDESGNSRPLVWAVREDAEAYADGLTLRAAAEMGDASFELDYQVVPLTGQTESENEPELVPLPAFGSDQCPHC
jgi:hypothetical protein